MFGINGGESMERRTQRRVVRKSRKIRKNVFLLLTLALILCLGTFAMGAQKGRETKTYYESVEIQRGDTIWDIAKEYKAEGKVFVFTPKTTFGVGRTEGDPAKLKRLYDYGYAHAKWAMDDLKKYLCK